MAPRDPTADIATPAAFADAVAKLAAPLGLDLAAITWKITPDKGATVTIRLVSEGAQLPLFTGNGR
jgi:hypothetical protein